LTSIFIKGLESALNRALRLDPDALAALDSLAGRTLAFDFENTGLVLYILPITGGVRLETECSAEVDVTIRGTPINLLAYLLSNPENSEGITGRLNVSGDVRLAQRFQKIIKGVDVDWEEHLSRWFGGTLARKLGIAVRNTMQFARSTRRTLELDVSEYLRYEKEVLPEQGEVNEYISAIDVLRDDAERLKQRIDRLIAGTDRPQ
jgi:ubiquinone biosynthesis protein UbiJ